jgi:hypothetical protein
MSSVQHSHKNETFVAEAVEGRSRDDVSKKPQRSSARKFAKLICPLNAICNA